MKANVQHKISIPNSGFKRSRFNWSHDVNSTFGWGDLQPIVCRFLPPGSKTTMQTQSLIRFAPMVSPTFGRVKYKTFSQFVGLSDVFPNLGSFLSQEPVTTGVMTRIATEFPHLSLGKLSLWCLTGARATLYWIPHRSNATDEYNDYVQGKYITQYQRWDSSTASWSLPQDGYSILTRMYAGSSVSSLGVISSAAVADPFGNSATAGAMPKLATGLQFYPSLLRDSSLQRAFAGDDSQFVEQFALTLGLMSWADFLPKERENAVSTNNPDIIRLEDYRQEVSLQSADYIVEFKLPEDLFDSGSASVPRYCALAFELSDFGKRLRKVIQGCGYQLDFTSDTQVSILPLLAFYKAYFDIFGLQLYQGWETTYCAKLIRNISNNFIGQFGNLDLTQPVAQRMFSLPIRAADYATVTSPNELLFVEFVINELGNCWYTDDADFVGAHIANLGVSPGAGVENIGQFISVAGNSNGWHDYANLYTQDQPNNNGQDYAGNQEYGRDSDGIGAPKNPHYFINAIQHGEVDTKLLMRMYRWVNRNTILGREIAKILRAQGLGFYVLNCKSNFIGSTDFLPPISDVVSLAATDDASLGEYGGRGLGYDKSGTLVFENDEFGYWITMATIVPESGYTQGIDPTIRCLDKLSLPHPDFDAIGMELTTKDVIVGSRVICPVAVDMTGSEVFGFVPRQSRWKVTKNLVNGDFNRHSKRSVYLPFTLDKQLSVNDCDVVASKYTPATSSAVANCKYVLRRSVEVQHMPVAGNVWRMPTKYAWMGNFDRIFRKIGIRDDDTYNTDSATTNNVIGIRDYNDDNFMLHMICDLQCYSPMKPIEDSYGLDDEDNPTFSRDSVGKA